MCCRNLVCLCCGGLQNDGLRDEIKFLEEQLDAARKENALLNVKLENSAVYVSMAARRTSRSGSVLCACACASYLCLFVCTRGCVALYSAREEGAALFTKLTDIVTKSQNSELQKDAEITRYGLDWQSRSSRAVRGRRVQGGGQKEVEGKWCAASNSGLARSVSFTALDELGVVVIFFHSD